MQCKRLSPLHPAHALAAIFLGNPRLYPFNLKRSAFYLLFCPHFVFHLAVSIYAQAH